jgi:hypothetical protein
MRECDSEWGPCSGRIRLREWYLLAHSAFLLVFLGMVAFLALGPGRVTDDSVLARYLLGPVFALCPGFAVADGLFALHVLRLLRVLCPYPEASSWDYYVAVTKCLIPFWGMLFYRRMRSAYDEALDARGQRRSGDASTCLPDGRTGKRKAPVLARSRVLRNVGDLVYAAWPTIVWWLVLQTKTHRLWQRPYVLRWADLADKPILLAYAVPWVLFPIVLLYTLSQVDRFERGWRKACWWAVLILILPLGASLYWFSRLRRKLRAAEPSWRG